MTNKPIHDTIVDAFLACCFAPSLASIEEWTQKATALSVVMTEKQTAKRIRLLIFDWCRKHSFAEMDGKPVDFGCDDNTPVCDYCGHYGDHNGKECPNARADCLAP